MLKKRIMIIGEGDEEECFFDLINDANFKVYDREKYELIFKNANGAGNVPAYFSDYFANLQYDYVYAFIDVDDFKTDFFENTREKIGKITGEDWRKNIIFTNPCTLQLLIAGFCEDELFTKAKPVNSGVVTKCWPDIKKTYDAHEWQLSIIKCSFDNPHIEKMISRIRKYSVKDTDKPSSSIREFLDKINNEDTSWTEE